MKLIFSILFVFIMSVNISYSQEQKNFMSIADSLHAMASNLFEHYRDENNALRLEKYVYALLTNTTSVDSTKYYHCIKALAEYYSNSNDGSSELAVKYYTEALDYCNRHYGNDTIDYPVMQSELGYLFLETNKKKGPKGDCPWRADAAA